jgi:hypothetical protein
MKIKELLLMHHSHLDIGYTHPQPVVWELHDRYLDEAIELCETSAAFPAGSRGKWTCEATQVVLHWLESATAAQVARMQNLVASGQMSFGAMLCHWTALHPEDLMQESLQPIKRLRALLGAKFEVAIQTDVNGVPWSTADLLLDAGISRLMMNINVHMGGYPLARPTIFRWQTPSGRELTVFSGEHYNAFSREAGLKQPGLSLERVAQGLIRYFKRLAAKGWQHDFAILTATHPVMDDNGPPNPELPGLVRRWNESGNVPLIRLVSVDEVFDKIATLDPASVPVHAGDWTDFWSNGVAASALDVALSLRAHGALWAAKALATQLPSEARIKTTVTTAAATEKLHLANEHTWTSYASTGALGVAGTGKIEPIPIAELSIDKSEKCTGALSLARLARRDALDVLAGNPVQSRTQEALLLFNPSDLPRSVCLRMTPDLASGTYHWTAGTKHRLDVIEDVLRDTPATAWYGPVDVPPLSIKTVKISDLGPGDLAPGLSRGTGEIASRFWCLRYQTATGAITSLMHRASGRECFDAATGFELFGPLQETVAEPSQHGKDLHDPRFDLFQVAEATFDEIVHSDVDGWATDWKAKHARPACVTRVETLLDADGAHLLRHLEMPGVNGEMQQTISLLAHEDRVRFEAFFNKADETNPESLFFTFPFKLENAQAHFDTAGVSVAYDKEQLPGACRDWFTAGSFVAVAGGPQAGDSGGCLTLACPDAPLFQLGGCNYARRQRDVSRINQALVMAWPTNNYWNTNFKASQPGWLRFRYELAYTPAYNPAWSASFAAAVRRPVMFHPVVSMAKGACDRALIAGLDADVTVVSLKPGTCGALIVGLRNHAPTPRLVRPIFPGRTPAAMARLNALEEDIRVLPLDAPIELAPRSTTWLRVLFDSPGSIAKSQYPKHCLI